MRQTLGVVGLVLVAVVLLAGGAGAATAISSGQTVTGSITAPSQTDVYTFSASAGNQIWLVMSGGSGRYPDYFQDVMDLYGPDGNLVTKAGGNPAQITAFAVPTSGTYELRCHDDNWNDSSAYSLTFIKRPGNVTYPGDLDGGPLASGATVNGSVTASDLDAYTFTAASGDFVTIVMSGGSGRYPDYFQDSMRLYGPDGTLVATSQGNPATLIHQPLAQAGQYFLICSDENRYDPGEYFLTFLQHPGQINSPDDPDGGPLTPGVDVSATVDVPSDLDVYTFTAEAQDRITLVMSGGSGRYPDYFQDAMRLYGPDNTLVVTTSGNPAMIDKLLLTQTGAYRLECSDSNYYEPGRYTLTYALTPIRPYLLTSRPAEAATNVPPNQRVFLRFSKAMWKAKVQANAHLRPVGEAAAADVPVTFDWRGTTVVYVVPSAPLAYNTAYEFVLGKAAQSGDRHEMAEDFRVAFTTSESFIQASTPAAGATDVAVATPVTLDLRWPARQGSVDTRLVVRNQGGTIVPGTVTWPTAFSRLTFTPNTPWTPGQTYTVRLNSGSRLRDDRLITWPESFTFTTAAASPSLALSAAAAGTASGGAQVTVNLTAAADVTMRVLNVAGHDVAVLPSRLLPAGVSTLLWSGQSATGTAVPAGQYLLRVTARSATGAQSSALATCQVKR